MIETFFPGDQLQYLHDREGLLSDDAIKFITGLIFEPPSLKTYDKGFNQRTTTTFNTTSPTISMFEDRLYYDEAEQQSYGKWWVFPIKGILSPCNNWCQLLSKLPMTSEIFEQIHIIPFISEMKWKLYAKRLHWIEFLFSLLLVVFFLTEIFLLHYNQVNQSKKIITGNIFHSILALLLLKSIKTEIKQITYSVKDYFLDWSNYIDLLFIFGMVCYTIVNFIFQFDNVFSVRMFGSIALIFGWIKIVTYLRGLYGFAFIILMLISVFDDMKYFFFILIWILLGFSFSFGLLQQRDQEETQDVFQMIKISHKVLLGDFDRFDEVMSDEGTGLQIFVWILFFFCTLLLIIIMLNLLIAFINDSYETLVKFQDKAFLSERIRLISYIETELSNGQRQDLDRILADQFVFYFEPVTQNNKVEHQNFEIRIEKKIDNFQKELFHQISDFSIEFEKIKKEQKELGCLKEQMQEYFGSIERKIENLSKN